MTVREIIYPHYDAEVFEGGDIRLRFWAIGSKFGSVRVVLTAADAAELRRILDKALAASPPARMRKT